ncbi:MAG: hypothetical protein LBL21_00605 [Rickettsiales bacterium]|jgi:hypothetical protein|nr:hypothetical protein [Rickettsiales bacterium]
MKTALMVVLMAAALGACGKKETAEDCIAWIYDNAAVYITSPSSVVLELKANEDRWVEINKETALSLSKNWTLDENMKYYTKDDVVMEHEKDACEVKAKIRKFLKNMD